MKPKWWRNSQRGFSLFELIIVLSITAILSVISAPLFVNLVETNRSAKAMRQLTRALSQTRAFAIARNKTMTLCARDGDHWQTGQLLVDEHKRVIRVFPSISSRLIWHGMGESGIRYLPTGFTAGQAGSFYFCPAHAGKQFAKRLVVALSGRVRVDDQTDDEYVGYCLISK